MKDKKDIEKIIKTSFGVLLRIKPEYLASGITVEMMADDLCGSTVDKIWRYFE